MPKSLRSPAVALSPHAGAEVVWSRDDESASKPGPELDAMAASMADIFGVVLLLPGLAWCRWCQAGMEVWAGIPDGVWYRCPDPSVRAVHHVDALVTDRAAWTNYTKVNWRKPLPRKRFGDAAHRRRTFVAKVSRAVIDPLSTVAPVVDIWRRRPD